MRKYSALLLAIPAVLLFAACAGSPAPTPSPTPSPSASPTATATPTPTATGQVDPNAPDGQCSDDVLSVSLGASDGGAGSETANIIFTNTGSDDCVLKGAPGVSVVGDGNGTELGAPADQIDDSDPVAVTLAPGGTAVASLQSVNIGTDGGPMAGNCDVAQGDGYRVFPPHSFYAVFVASAGVPACTNGSVWMHVQPVAAG